MTREEILNMPAGSEMDILISEHVFGMRREKNYGLAGGFYWVGNGVTFGEQPANEVTEYSTDIAAAWQVVEKIETGMINKVHGQWEAYCQNVRAVADTAPLAICRAALLAVMEP